MTFNQDDYIKDNTLFHLIKDYEEALIDVNKATEYLEDMKNYLSDRVFDYMDYQRTVNKIIDIDFEEAEEELKKGHQK